MLPMLMAAVKDFAPDTDVLVLGSSHPFHAVDPAAARRLRMWNASVISGDIYTAYHLYLRLRKEWPRRPNQIVLLGEDFWLHAGQMEYTSYFTFSVVFHVIADMPCRSSLLMRPYERIARQMLRNPAELKLTQPCRRGHIELCEEEGESAAERFARQSKGLSHAPTELQWFTRLREAVEVDGRRLVLVRIPHRADYIEAAHASGLDLWAPTAPIHEGLPLFDHFELQPPSPNCFANADHLSPEGAAWFTPIVEQDLLDLLSR